MVCKLKLKKLLTCSRLGGTVRLGIEMFGDRVFILMIYESFINFVKRSEKTKNTKTCLKSRGNGIIGRTVPVRWEMVDGDQL